VIKFVEIIEKAGNHEEDCPRIKTPQIGKRDEEKAGDCNSNGHRDAADEGFWLAVDLSLPGEIYKAYSGSKLPEAGQEENGNCKRQEQGQKRLIFT